jgi:hypothetical protein
MDEHVPIVWRLEHPHDCDKTRHAVQLGMAAQAM